MTHNLYSAIVLGYKGTGGFRWRLSGQMDFEMSFKNVYIKIKYFVRGQWIPVVLSHDRECSLNELGSSAASDNCRGQKETAVWFVFIELFCVLLGISYRIWKICLLTFL